MAPHRPAVPAQARAQARKGLPAEGDSCFKGASEEKTRARMPQRRDVQPGGESPIMP